eukprot:g15535.t1
MTHLLRFVLAGGDNFYSGCPQGKMEQVWIARYDISLTCVPWYAILGNHDFDFAPYTAAATVFSQTNGSVEFVKTKRECTAPSHVPACWAMPAANFVVRAWEESLGVTIVGTDANNSWMSGYPFSDAKFRDRAGLGRLAAEGHALLHQALIVEESAPNVLVLNHYPYDTGGYGATLNAVAAKGKSVYYFAGHTHNTDDPAAKGFNTPGGVKALIAGAAGGYCGDDCQFGKAAVVFGMVKIDGTLQFERVPGVGTPIPSCHK